MFLRKFWKHLYMHELEKEYEEYSRKVTQQRLKSILPRELLPNTAYAPIQGIYDIGWQEWLDLPAADFVKELRKLDDKIIQENYEWTLRLAPFVHRGEFSLEQLKIMELQSFLDVDNFAVEIVSHVFDNIKDRDVRDIIMRHASEEIGHAELKADFLVHAFGLDRQRDIWNAKPIVPNAHNWVSAETDVVKKLKKLCPPLAYATIPFLERSLPRNNRLMAEGLRKHYGFPSRILGFYDLHTYVDIYHERLGLYVIGKYATTKELQDLLREAIISKRENQVRYNMGIYDYISKVK
jgi:pyrroloquinoline quinone (PQQ) biosynthesis protein C